MLKRVFDIVFSIVVLLVFFPLAIIIMIILLLTGEHEVFYLQGRVGKGGRIFKMIKFATMVKNSPNIGTGDITVKNDPRVLPIGNLLRLTKLNEMPQFVNVLIGNMSVVGPRPLTRKNYDYYTDEQKQIIDQLKPGVSGVGSIIFRDEEEILAKSEKPYIECYRTEIAPYKAALEEWYLNHKSLWTDIKVIFLTVWVIFFKKSRLPYNILTDLPKRS